MCCVPCTLNVRQSLVPGAIGQFREWFILWLSRAVHIRDNSEALTIADCWWTSSASTLRIVPGTSLKVFRHEKLRDCKCTKMHRLASTRHRCAHAAKNYKIKDVHDPAWCVFFLLVIQLYIYVGCSYRPCTVNYTLKHLCTFIGLQIHWRTISLSPLLQACDYHPKIPKPRTQNAEWRTWPLDLTQVT